MIKRVAVVKLAVNNGSGDGGSCFGIEVWTDTAKLANMVIGRFGDRLDLVRESEVFIKYEAKVSSRVRYKIAAKINWHRYGTKLRHCHPRYSLSDQG